MLVATTRTNPSPAMLLELLHRMCNATGHVEGLPSANRGIQGYQIRAHDVIDIGKVTLHLPVVININWLTIYDRFCKLVVGHIRASERPINSKEPQPRCWDIE